MKVMRDYVSRMGRLAAIAAAVVALLGTSLPAHAQDDTDPEGRPVLPDERLYPTDHFLIHYSLGGTAAVDPADTDADGVPDYVDFIGEALEAAWQFQIDEMGFVAPPADFGIGGDNRLDIYLTDLLPLGIAGYVTSYNGFVGDNPNSSAIERTASTSFMVLDHAYSELPEESTGNDPGAERLRFIESTVAHELFHMVQSGYDSLDAQHWLYEASATWMEYTMFGASSDALSYLELVVKNPDICLPSRSGRANDGLRWYASWLFIQHLSERYGEDTPRRIWEAMRARDGYDAIDDALAPSGASLEQASYEYALANLLRSYEAGSTFPPVRLEGTIERTGAFEPADGVQGLSADYLRLAMGGQVAITMNDFPLSTTVLAAAIREDGQADIYGLGADAPLVLDLEAYPEVYLIVHNNNRPQPRDGACVPEDYSVQVEPSNDPLSTPIGTRPAASFVTPAEEPIYSGTPDGLRVDEPFTGADPGTFSTEPEDLALNFTSLIPDAVPAGYAFEFATRREPESFGALEEYYAPGGELVANYDYRSQNGGWIGITQSPSPYYNLAEWLDDIDYESPGEIIYTQAGSEILLEDLTRNNETWISATLILNGLFIVVDSNDGEAAVLEMVTAVEEAAGMVYPEPQTSIVPTPVPPSFTPGQQTESESAIRASLAAATLMMCGGTLAMVLLGVLLTIGVAVGFR